MAEFGFGAGLIAGLLTLSACATAPGTEGQDRDRPAFSGADGTDCITNRGIRRFERLDDRNLIIYASGNRPYHVELSTPSQNIEHEIRIGVIDNDGRICPYSGDAILIQGPFNERIPISSIDALNDEELDILKNQFGVLDPDNLE